MKLFNKQSFLILLLLVSTLLPLKVVNSQTNSQIEDKSIYNLIDKQWQSCTKLLSENSFQNIPECINVLAQYREKLALSGFTDYSIDLIKSAQLNFDRNEIENANLLYEQAIKLSPKSSFVLFKSLNYIYETKGTHQAVKHFLSALKFLPYDYLLSLSLLKSLIYPTLWSASFALYTVFFLVFISNMADIIRTVANYLPSNLRGILAPIITAIIIILPCFFGLILCLSCWSVLIILILPHRKWFGIIGGTLLIFWGLLIPIRENLNYWLNHSGASSYILYNQGYWGSGFRNKIEQLLEDNKINPAIWYSLSQIQLNSGDLDNALSSAQKSEELYGVQPYTLVLRGSIAYLKGDVKLADQLFTQAEDEGLNSTGLYYNLSRTKFDLLDLESHRKYIALAQKSDIDQVKRWEQMQDLEGKKSVFSVGSTSLPLIDLVSLFFSNSKANNDKINSIFNALLAKSNATWLILFGIITILLSITIKSRGLRKYSKYFANYQIGFAVSFLLNIIPGGIFVILDQPYLSLGLIFISISLFLPLLGWPFDYNMLSKNLTGIWSIYTCLVIFFVFIVYYISYLMSRAKACKQE